MEREARMALVFTGMCMCFLNWAVFGPGFVNVNSPSRSTITWNQHFLMCKIFRSSGIFVFVKIVEWKMDVDISLCRKTISEQKVNRSSVLFNSLTVFKLFSPVLIWILNTERIWGQRKLLCARFTTFFFLREIIPERLICLFLHCWWNVFMIYH